MSPAQLSATDTFTPAMERTKHMLFKPFRFSIWWRLAILGLLTGEMSGNGFNFNFPTNFGNTSGGKARDSFLNAPFPFHEPSLPVLIAIIAGVVLVGLVLFLIFAYISSILRFVLFDAVLSGKVRIREGWRRWRERGRKYFPWQIGYGLVMLAIYAVLFGVPIFMAWRAGIFRNPSQHLALLILGGLALVFMAVVVVLAGLAVYVLTKDFVVPIMAFEGVGPVDGWRRLKLMIGASKGSYAGYLGFKAVLAIAAGIAVGIIGFILFFAVLIPFIIIGVIVGVAGSSAGTGMSAMMLTLLIVGGIIIGLLLVSVMSLVSVPVVVFFQSYALHFFGSRYEPLRTVLYPPPPPQMPPQAPPAPEPPPVPPMPQPAF